MKVARILVIVCALLLSVTAIQAKTKVKEFKEVTFKVEQMNNTKVEKEVISALRYARGVEKIDTDVRKSTVEIKYNADKTNANNLRARLEKKKFRVSTMKAVQPVPVKVEPQKSNQKTDSRSQERTR